MEKGEYKNDIISEYLNTPLAIHLGFEIDGLDYGFVRVKVPFKEKLTQDLNSIHGGVISTLCDSAVAYALATMFDQKIDMLTIDLKVNYLAPAKNDIFAEAKIIHKGKKTAVGEVDVKDSSGTLIAKSLVTYYLRISNNKK